MASNEEVTRVAAGLMRGWVERTVVEMPTNAVPGFAKSDAQAVAERLRELRIAAGDVPAGYKVGFTNARVREQFGADGLLAATVYKQTILSERAVVAASYLGPRLEPEVVLGVEGGEVAWAALAFEIVQSHASDWKFGWIDAIADFGLHAALIVGERRALGKGEAAGFAGLRVRLLQDAEVVERGGGSDIDGGPLASVVWLREDLARCGRTLGDGELVSTGSLTRVPAIVPGERWTVEAEDGALAALSIEVV